MANSVQLPLFLIGPGDKLLELRGQAQFGRLGVRSFIGGQVPQSPRFTPGALGYLFDARGYVDIPLDDPLFGPSFLLSVSAGASSSCGNEMPHCLAITDFGNTALIGNARIVDQNGVLIPDALFASASGYDYITPPGPLNAIPEPESYAMLLVGLGLLGFAARRRQRNAAA